MQHCLYLISTEDIDPINMEHILKSMENTFINYIGDIVINKAQIQGAWIFSKNDRGMETLHL